MNIPHFFKLQLLGGVDKNTGQWDEDFVISFICLRCSGTAMMRDTREIGPIIKEHVCLWHPVS